MNNGKICISVCAETTGELVEQIKRAGDLADVVEIRFDCLKSAELNKTKFKLPVFRRIFLVTFRPREQGGKRDFTIYERLDFWKSVFWLNRDKEFFVDIEFDISEAANFGNSQMVVSYHDFIGNFETLTVIYNLLTRNSESIPKIAIQADDITDTIPIWKLLEKAKSDGKQIIPIAMGESGKWTRILGLAHGAFMTYAALDSGKETAPGQVSAKDLTEVYRVKKLDEKTEVYGIIGGNTAYSMSPYIHNAAFKSHKLNAVFVPLQTKKLDEFIKRMVKPETREIELNFKGFAVTIPHKQNIIKHLDRLDDSAEKIGAVNTVKIKHGKLYGYNTDAHGFIEPLKNAYGELKNVKVAVLGAGGAARACIYALKTEGANVTLFARNIEKAKLLAEEFEVELQELKTQNSKLKTFEIVVNATPLGTLGELENETPATSEQLKNIQLAYDLVYNPFETRFLREAKNADVPTIGGMAMLIAQAMKQQKIWTGLNAPMKEMSQAALQKLK
jgi:3-dehydroquinate dehydratase / shikimate dehydrogenase